LHEGRRFSQLIRDRGRLFPGMYASIVEAGEESGALPQVLSQLHAYLLMSKEMRAFILSASIYPVFVLSVCLAVISILLGWVVPRFTLVIRSMAREPTFATRLLIDLSQAFRSFWWLVPVGVAVVVLLAWQIRRGGKLKEKWDEWVLRLPLLGRLVLLSNIGRLIRTMSILMKSGVHILDTVSISARVLSNFTLRNSISGLAAELRRGERLSAALSRSNYIPPLVIRMLAVGEETGAPDEMLERVADRYDNELKQLVKRALAWFEPVTIILLGGIVGFIVLMLFLTILDLQSGI
jgi:type II secretory pathway component PulF